MADNTPWQVIKKGDYNMSKPTKVMSADQLTTSKPDMAMNTSRETQIMETGVSGKTHINIGNVLGDTYTIKEAISEATGESQIFLCSDNQLIIRA